MSNTKLRWAKSVGLCMFLLSACRERLRVPAIEAGRPILHELAPGATRSYRFSLRPGQICTIQADQLGLDLLIRIVPPGGKGYEIDRWSSPAGFERVEVISDTEAEHHLDIVSRDKDGAAGKFRLSLGGCRAATAEDRKRTALLREAYRHYMIGQMDRESDDPAERQKALLEYQTALPIFKQAGDTLGELTTITYIGETFTNMSEDVAALKCYEEALPLWRAANDTDGLAETLHNIGTAYYGIGEFSKALAFYDEALPQWNAAGDVRGAAATQANIGRVFDSRGEYQRALSSYILALDLAKRSGDKSWEAQIRHNTGMVMLALGAVDEAIQEYVAAIDLSRQAHDKWSEGHMQHHLGEAQLAKQELGAAEQSLNEALKVSQEVGDDLGRATTLLHLGQIHHSKGNHQQALQSFQESLLIRSQKRYRLGEPQDHYLIGREFLDLDKLVDARTHLDQALAIAIDLKEPRSQAQAMYGLAAISRRQQHPADALRWLDRAIGLVEELRTHVRAHELRALFVSTVYDYYEAARDNAMELDEKVTGTGRGGRAFGYAERARARSLLDAFAEASADTPPGGAAASKADKDRQGDDFQALMERRLFLVSRNPDPNALRTIDQKIAEAASRFRSAQAEPGQRGHVAAPPQTASTSAIQSRLTSRGKAFLEFSLGTSRSYLWVVTATGTSVFTLPSREVIESQAHLYLDDLRPKSAGTARTSKHPGHAPDLPFSKMILGSAWHILRDQVQWMIVGDGILHYVPVSALPSPVCDPNTAPKGRCDPLLLTHEISYLPSGSVGLALANARPAGRSTFPGGALMYVDPIYGTSDVRLQLSPAQRQACEATGAGSRREKERADPAAGPAPINLKRLLYSGDEAQAVATMMPAGKLMVQAGASASLNNLGPTSSGNFDIIHFATHALADPALFQGSGIVLSLYDACGNPIPGFLPAARLADLHLVQHPLVTLSACETALGREVRGEGVVGLVYAFLRAGAGSVVATLWKVDDAATAELMKHFYTGLIQQHLEPGVALHNAQKKIYLEFPEWQDPGFWAGFVFEGNGAVGK